MFMMIQKLTLERALRISVHNCSFSEEHAISETSLVENIFLEQVYLANPRKLLVIVEFPSKTSLFLTFWVSKAKLLALTTPFVIIVVTRVLNQA